MISLQKNATNDEMAAAVKMVMASRGTPRIRVTPTSFVIEPPPYTDKASANRSANEFVYLIGFDDWVKIGYTSVSVKKRLEGLQTNIPIKLCVIHSMPGSLRLEAQLHKRFAAYRRQGEWFSREGALAEWIDAGCPMEDRDEGV